MKQKRAVLITVGRSPAVVTETVYGLYARDLETGSGFPETVVKAFTTTEGRQMVIDELITGGVFEAMRRELALDHVCPLTKDDVVTFDGLSDIRSEEDVLAMSDKLCKSIAEWTQDDAFQVCASIAGGRKPMSMQMGFALTILGRRGDELTHVLTDPESPNDYCNSNFYYPSENNKGSCNIDVQLISVPIPLLGRKTLPSLGTTRTSYTNIVSVMQSMIAPIAQIDLQSGTLLANGVEVPLGPRDLALYTWVCLRHQNDRPIRSPYSVEHIIDKLRSIKSHDPNNIDHLVDRLAPEIVAAKQIIQIYDDLPRARTRLKHLYPFEKTPKGLGLRDRPCITPDGWSTSLSRIKKKFVHSLGSEAMAKPFLALRGIEKTYDIDIAPEDIDLLWSDPGRGDEILATDSKL